MVNLRLGGTEYPLVLTVGALDALAQMGITIENLFQYFSVESRTFDEAVEHGLQVLGILLEGGRIAEAVRSGTEPADPLSMDMLRPVLTPGQVWGLCEAAIIDSMKRTVEADHSKNAESAV